MSYLHCNRCGDLINTDDDPGAYVIPIVSPRDELVPRVEWICERCREDGELEEEDE